MPRLLSRIIALASASTTRRRVYTRYAMGDSDASALSREVATARVSAYEQRLGELAQRVGLDSSKLTDSAVLSRTARESTTVAQGVVETHNRELQTFIGKQPKTITQRELATNVRAWEQQRAQSKSTTIALTEGMTGRNAADADFIKRNKLSVRGRLSPRSSAEPKCAALVARGYMRVADMDFSLPLHPRCVHGLEYDRSLDAELKDRDDIWLGSWQKRGSA